MGAQMVKEVASKTSDVAGDGTTTATVLAEAFIEGLRNVTAGQSDGVETRHEKAGRGGGAARETEKKVRGETDVIKNGGDFGEQRLRDRQHHRRAMEKVGNDGTITVEEAKGIDTTLRS